MVESRELKFILNAVDNVSSKFKGIENQLESTGKKMKSVGKSMSLAITAPLSLMGGLAVNQFASFEKQMSMVEAITGATGEEMARLTGKAKDLGATTAFTAKQAGDAMQYLGMAGYDTNEIFESIGPTLDLAAAGQIDLGRAADIATNILSGFRLEASESNRVMDVMAATATSSNTNIEELGEAMKYLAPVAASMGISIEESSALVGKLANNGLKGGMATRALQASLQNLAEPTAEMNDALNRANVHMWDMNGNFVGLADMVRQFEEGLKGMTEQQKLATIGQIFGKESAKQMLIVINEGSESLIKYTKELKNSEGAAKRMAEIQLDNLAGKFTILRSAISGAAIEIGGALSPALEDVIDWAQGVADKFNGMSDTTKKLILIFGVFIATIGPAVFTIGKLIAVFNMAKGAMIALNTAMIAGRAATIALLGPWGLAIAAAGILAGVLGYELFSGTKKVEDEMKNLTSQIDDKLNESLDDATTGINKVGYAANQSSEDLKNLGEEAEEARKKIKKLHEEISDEIVGATEDEADARKNIAEELLQQEQKVADLKKEIAEKSLEITDQKSIEELRILQEQLQKEELALQNAYWIRDNMSKEVLEAERRASLTAFERRIEDINEERVANLKRHIERIAEIIEEIKEEQAKNDAIVASQKAAQEAIRLEIEATTQKTKEETEKQKAYWEEVRMQHALSQYLSTGEFSSNEPIIGGDLYWTQGKAKGGPVNAGTPYFVGEEGPEMFVPNNSGTIIPNNKIGGVSVNIVVNGDVSGQELIRKVSEGIMRSLKANLKIA